MAMTSFGIQLRLGIQAPHGQGSDPCRRCRCRVWIAPATWAITPRSASLTSPQIRISRSSKPCRCTLRTAYGSVEACSWVGIKTLIRGMRRGGYHEAWGRKPWWSAAERIRGEREERVVPQGRNRTTDSVIFSQDRAPSPRASIITAHKKTPAASRGCRLRDR